MTFANVDGGRGFVFISFRARLKHNLFVAHHCSTFSRPGVYLVVPTFCRKVGCVTAASYMGALVAFSVSPAIMRSTGGWEAVFYAFGGASLLLLPAWVFLPLGNAEGDTRQWR